LIAIINTTSSISSIGTIFYRLPAGNGKQERFNFFFRNILIVFCVLLFFISTEIKAQEIKKSTKTETIEDKKFYLHTVEKGQTLFSIAKAYEVSKNDIILENPELIDGLKDNIVIKIPFVKKENAASSKPMQTNEHKVESGQTLYAISKKYNTTVDNILALNPEVKQNGLKSGQIILVPVPAAVSTVPVLKETPSAQKEKETSPVKKQEAVKPISPPAEIKPQLTYQKPVKTEAPASVNYIDNRVPGEINVALLAPFYTSFNNLSDSGLTTEMYSKSNIAVEFYQGFKLAADSLTKVGYKIKLSAFDTENDSATLAAILNQQEFKQANLIVGPFYEKELQHAAHEVKKNNVPLVSPFSQSNKPLLSNPFISKTIASQATESEEIASYAAKNFAGINTILISSDNAKDKSLAEIIKRKYNLVKQKGDSLKLFVHHTDFKGLESLLSSDKNNVLIVAINDQAFVTELFNFIKQQKNIPLTIFGCDTWFNFENLDIDALVNNNVHLPTTYFVDYEQPRTKQIIKNFRGEYNTDPTKYALHGFDVGMFYIKAARDKQAMINDIDKYKETGIQTVFNFYQTAVDSGWENRNVHILKYDNYKLIKVN
jgi:ABC-type branched-subunit amino acid transport system substrate-binding protein/LysM repeat protein